MDMHHDQYKYIGDLYMSPSGLDIGIQTENYVYYLTWSHTDNVTSVQKSIMFKKTYEGTFRGEQLRGLIRTNTDPNLLITWFDSSRGPFMLTLPIDTTPTVPTEPPTVPFTTHMSVPICSHSLLFSMENFNGDIQDADVVYTYSLDINDTFADLTDPDRQDIESIHCAPIISALIDEGDKGEFFKEICTQLPQKMPIYENILTEENIKNSWQVTVSSSAYLSYIYRARVNNNPFLFTYFALHFEIAIHMTDRTRR